MNKWTLKKVLNKHQIWLDDPSKGERAYLGRADLIGADLSGANLRDAYLRGADLRGADLRGADLRNTNLINTDLRGIYLRDANLRGANLLGADLRSASLCDAKGFLLLPVQDPRGYSFPHAVLHDQWMIHAGCRFFTIGQAKDHWGDHYPRREIGDMYLHAVDWLESKIKRVDEEA